MDETSFNIPKNRAIASRRFTMKMVKTTELLKTESLCFSSFLMIVLGMTQMYT